MLAMSMPTCWLMPSLLRSVCEAAIGGADRGLQRLGPGHRARLVPQHIEIVLKVQHLLASAVAALMARNQPTRVPNLDVQRMHTRLHPGARLDRHRVEVGGIAPVRWLFRTLRGS